jgi:hypothetical protein
MDPLCRNYTNTQSACSACYDGYTLSNGQCIISSSVSSENTDPYCIKLQGVTCLTCANGYYLPSNGSCTQLNPLCKTSDMATGYCTLCYTGFTLSGTTCVQGGAALIPYCAQVTGIVCGECINGYYVSNGGCVAINMLCATYNHTDGSCFTCIPGYVFQTGSCILPSLGLDPNCIQYAGSYCSTCASGYNLVNYWCNAIDPNCAQFDPSNTYCLYCRNGKSPQGLACV